MTSLNLTVLPLVYSLIHQHFPSHGRFVAATFIATALVSFVFEPILNLLGYFQLLKWKYYYTFPVYIIVAIVIRWTVCKVFAIAKKAKNEG